METLSPLDPFWKLPSDMRTIRQFHPLLLCPCCCPHRPPCWARTSRRMSVGPPSRGRWRHDPSQTPRCCAPAPLLCSRSPWHLGSPWRTAPGSWKHFVSDRNFPGIPACTPNPCHAPEIVSAGCGRPAPGTGAGKPSLLQGQATLFPDLRGSVREPAFLPRPPRVPRAPPCWAQGSTPSLAGRFAA